MPMLSREQFKAMKEDELCHEVIMPVLKEMGYRDVFEYHGGSAEQGKDIVCWKEDSSGRRDNLAIVAKAVPLTGQAKGKGSAGEVAMQVNQCFGESFPDPLTGIEQDVHQVWVVTNKKITKEAEKAILSGLHANNRRYVLFVSGDKLWEYVEKYLLVAFLQALEKTAQEAAAADSHYYPLATITPSGSHIVLQEKYPGASRDKPINIRGRIELPNDAAGRAIKEALDLHLQTGAPVDIPAVYIKELELPDFFQRLTGIDPSQLESLSLEAAPQLKSMVVTVSIVREDGYAFTMPHVELKLVRAGTEKATFTNEEQPIPFLVTVVLQSNTKSASISLAVKQGTYNALQLKHVTQFYECFTQPTTISVVFTDTGIPFFSVVMSKPDENPIHPQIVEMIHDLAAIQERVRRPIYIPDRNPTKDERVTIAKLRIILHEGVIEGTWKSIDMSFDADQLRNLIETFKTGADHRLRGETIETETLFGTEIPLGKVIQIWNNIHLRDISKLEKRLKSLPPGEEVISIKLYPKGNNKATVTYVDWVKDKSQLNDRWFGDDSEVAE